MKYLRFISNIVDIIVSPIRQEPIFIFWCVFLMIYPTIVNALWINGNELSLIYIMQTNRFGAAIPYVLFIPIVAAYLLAVLQLILRYSWLKWLIYISLLLLSCVNLFLLLNFSTLITPMMFTLLTETTGAETTGFLSTYMFSEGTFLTLLVLVLLFFIILYCEKCKLFHLVNPNNGVFIKYPLFFILVYFFYRGLACTLFFFSLFQCKTPADIEKWSHGFKYETNTLTNFVYSLYDFSCQKYELDNFYKVMCKIDTTVVEAKDDSVDIVLVIGESYNKYHSSLYNYQFKTSPYMEMYKRDGNLLAFDNVITPYNLTSFVIKNIMSTNSLSDYEQWSNYPLFPALFKKAGYDVLFWDNQMLTSGGDVSDFSLNSLIHNPTISKMAYNKVNQHSFKYDEELVDDFRKENPVLSKKNLIIFHLQGQHFEAKDRFPANKGFDFFKPGQYYRPDLSDGMKEEIAEYDNATLYNDFVLYKIVNLFKNRNAVVIILSDHGEEVYDYRCFLGRTHEDEKSDEALKYQYEVPFLIWMSDEFIDRNSLIFDDLKGCIHKNLMIDNVSQLLMRLGGLKCSYYKAHRDPLSDHFIAGPRLVNNRIDYDYQMNN